MRRRLIGSAALAALLLVAAPLLAACQPTWSDQMKALDRLVHRTSYDGWRYLTADGAALGRRLHPWLDWSTDGCSAPLIGRGPFDFTLACARHDLAWRNLRRIEARFSRDVWNAANKLEADRRFLADLRARCARLSRLVVTACLVMAEVYALAVTVLAPRGAPWAKATGRFRW